MRASLVILFSSLIVFSAFASLAKVPYREGHELTNQKLAADPLFRWKLNKEVPTGTQLVRECPSNRIFTGAQFTNHAALSKEFEKVPAHETIQLSGTVYLFGGWNNNSHLILKINGKQIWQTRISALTHVPVCGENDYKIRFKATYTHPTSTNFSISFEDNLNATDSSLTWGLSRISVSLRSRARKHRAIWQKRYFGSNNFEGSPTKEWRVATQIPEPVTTCGETQLFGGVQKFNGLTVKRTYRHLPVHSSIQIKGQLFLIDKWEKNILRANLGKHTVTRTTRDTNNADSLKGDKQLCGSETVDHIFNFEKTIKSKKEIVTLKFADNLKPTEGSWGIANLQITLLDGKNRPIISWTEGVGNHSWSKWKFERTAPSTAVHKCAANTFLGGPKALRANESLSRCFKNMPRGAIIEGSFEALAFGENSDLTYTFLVGRVQQTMTLPSSEGVKKGKVCGDNTEVAVLYHPNFTFTYPGHGRFCVRVAPATSGNQIAVRDFKYKVTAPCRSSCATCTRWDKCDTCAPHASIRKGGCRCQTGFLTASTDPLRCIPDPIKDLKCPNGAKNIKRRDLTETHLRNPHEINSWTVNGHPINNTNITRCGRKSHMLGGRKVFGSAPVTIQKTYKNLAPHFKALIRVKVFIIDGIVKGAGANIPNLNLRVDNGEHLPIGLPEGEIKQTHACEANHTVFSFYATHTISHSKGELTLTIDGAHGGAAWGIQDIKIDLVPCSKGCAQCSSCTQCTKCDDGIDLIKGACSCRAGTQKVKLGNQYVCDDTHDCARNGVKRIATLGKDVFAKNETLKASNWTLNGKAVDGESVFQCTEHKTEVQRKVLAKKLAAKLRKEKELKKKGQAPSKKNGTKIGKPSKSGKKNKTQVKVEVGVAGVNGSKTVYKKVGRDGRRKPRMVFRAIGPLAADARLVRNFHDLPPHFGLRINARVYAIGDEAHREVANSVVNHISAAAGENKFSNYNGHQAVGKLRQCKKNTHNFQSTFNFWRFLANNATNFDLTLTGDNLQIPAGQGWAVNNVRIYACQCPKGCASCSDATHCTACKNPQIEVGKEGKCNKCRDASATYRKGQCFKTKTPKL